MTRHRAPLLLLLAAGLAAAVWLLAQRDPSPGEGDESARGSVGPALGEELDRSSPAPARGEAAAGDPGAGPDDEGPAREPARASLPGLRGLVRTTGGAPAPGFLVQLASESEVLAEARSDADGRFRLPLRHGARGEGALWVELVLPEDWVCAEQRRLVEADATAGSGAAQEEELVFEVRRLRRGPLRGLVVDRASGEPVPRFLLRVVDSGGLRGIAVSGADGRFATAEEFYEGNLFVAPLDQPAYEELEDVGFLHPHLAADAPEEVRLEVRVGPTYLLELGRPPGLETAQLAARLRSGDVQVLRDEDASRPAPVRDDPRPWVRFRPLEARLSGPPYVLEVQSRDGVWAGSASVATVHGVHAEPVAIELTARGRLRGRVLDASGGSVASAEVRLVPEPAEPAGAARLAGRLEVRELTRGNGLYDLRGLPPGTWRLTVAGREHSLHEEQVRVLAGETTERDVALERAPVGGDVIGRIEAVAPNFGTHAIGSVQLSLESRRRTDRVFHASARLERDEATGVWSGRFLFPGVPLDEYELRVVAPDAFRWDPPRMAVTPPQAGLTFVFRGDVATATLALLVVDRATGRELASFDLEYWFGGDARLGAFRGTSTRNPFVLGRHPLDRELTWLAGAPGYRARRGDLSDFDDEGWSFRTARVELERGWGAELVVLEAGTRAPVADALVLLDGEEAGRTDEEGRLEAEWSVPPQRVEVRVPGRRLAGGDVEPTGATGGRLPPGLLRYELLVEEL